MSFLSMHNKSLPNASNNTKRSPSKFLSALITGVSISTIGALSMTAPTLASAKTVQPSTEMTVVAEDLLPRYGKNNGIAIGRENGNLSGLN